MPASVQFTRMDYGSAEAKSTYGSSAYVPRWKWEKDGKTEYKIGVLTPDQINSWIGASP